MDPSVQNNTDVPAKMRHMDHICMRCNRNLVSRQPLVNIETYKCKSGNVMCKPCRASYKNRLIKCNCGNTAYNWLILDYGGYGNLDFFCERCI